MIVQGMQTQSCELEVLAHANAFFTSFNTSVMAQLAKMTVTMNAMQAQLKTLKLEPKNQNKVKDKVLLLDLWE